MDADPSTSRQRTATAAVASPTAQADALLAQTPTAPARPLHLDAHTFPLVDAAAAHHLAPTPTADVRLRRETDTGSQEVVTATGPGLVRRSPSEGRTCQEMICSEETPRGSRGEISGVRGNSVTTAPTATKETSGTTEGTPPLPLVHLHDSVRGSALHCRLSAPATLLRLTAEDVDHLRQQSVSD